MVSMFKYDRHRTTLLQKKALEATEPRLQRTLGSGRSRVTGGGGLLTRLRPWHRGKIKALLRCASRRISLQSCHESYKRIMNVLRKASCKETDSDEWRGHRKES